MSVVMQEAAQQWAATLKDIRRDAAERQAAETRATEEQVTAGVGAVNRLVAADVAAAEVVLEEAAAARKAAEIQIAAKEASEMKTIGEDVRKRQGPESSLINHDAAKRADKADMVLSMVESIGAMQAPVVAKSVAASDPCTGELKPYVPHRLQSHRRCPQGRI